MVETSQRIGAGFLTLFFGFIGDLISRSKWYSCSGDKLWSLGFFVFPLSIGSASMYWADAIEPGATSCSTVLDLWLIFLPVIVIIVSVLLPKLVNPGDDTTKPRQFLYNLFYLTIMIVLFALLRFYKYSEECSDLYPEQTDRPDWKIFLKSLMWSAIINTVIIIANWILSTTFVQMIPVVGIGFKAWNKLGTIVPGSTHAILLTLAHWIMNLQGNDTTIMQPICTPAS